MTSGERPQEHPDTLKCPACKGSISWTAPFYQTIPAACPSCGTKVRAQGERSGAHLIIIEGKIVEALWHEWDHDLLGDVREDLKDFDDPRADAAVHEVDLDDVFEQGNGHRGAPVRLVPRADRDRRERERAEKAHARAERLGRVLPIARDLATMMHGRHLGRFDGEWLEHDRVDCIHPQDGGTVDDTFMREYRRRAAVTRAWLEALLGEPVAPEANFLDVAERWEAKGRPQGAPCAWGAP